MFHYRQWSFMINGKENDKAECTWLQSGQKSHHLPLCFNAGSSSMRNLWGGADLGAAGVMGRQRTILEVAGCEVPLGPM
jgi:hypothetical protein